MKTPLQRSRDDTMISGVCGGLGKYLGIDSTLVRVFFVILSLGNGIGVLVYFLFWIIVPLEGQRRAEDLGENVRTGSQEIADRARQMGTEFREIVRHPSPQSGIFIGAALVLLGVVYLIENLNLSWLRWFHFSVIWPVLLILSGLVLLFRRSRGE